jgi:hypothetical protein
MTKIAGSESISQMHGSGDPDLDPPQKVMDPQHWKIRWHVELLKFQKMFTVKI